ncbi:MAG: AraC family ligand binding domain-containing protein [Acidobacteria bacterium]|nr:AraC family ligand binding domain-containing protein [Acidobacteriota bacterium]
MPRLIQSPTIIPAAGNKPKVIREYIGRVNTKHPQVSIAAMESPEGWVEPGQRPEFYEFTVVQSGTLRVEDEHGQVIDVSSGQAVITEPGEWVRYSSPHAGGATYMAICLPAFSPDMVHRDTQ